MNTILSVSKISKLPPLGISKPTISFKEYITLADANCPDEELKSAAIVAVHTGLRYEQIRELRIADLKNLNLPAPLVSAWLDNGKESMLLFPNLPHYSWIETPLRQWARAAKIRHNITFHGFSCAHYAFAKEDNDPSIIFNTIQA